MMDVDWLSYSYSVLAAAAFYHFSTFEVVHKVSGESTFDLRPTGVGAPADACVCVRPDLGQRGALRPVDGALRGHSAR